MKKAKYNGVKNFLQYYLNGSKILKFYRKIAKSIPYWFDPIAKIPDTLQVLFAGQTTLV